MRALVDASHPGPVLGVTVAATGYAVVVGRSAGGTILVMLAVLTGQLAIGWQNDATDAERDALVKRQDKPIVTGAVSRRLVGGAAIAAGAATVPLSLASGWHAGLTHLVAVGAAAGYNAGLKSGPLSFLPYATAFGLLPAFVTLGARGSPWPPWWVIAGTATLGSAAHFLNVAPDREADLATGVRSLPHRLPTGANACVAAALALFSSACLAFGPRSFSALRLVGFSLVALLAVLGAVAGARGSRTGFRAIVVVAVADVGLLLLTR